MTKKEILEIYKHWCRTHPRNWETDNLVGDILGWPEEYQNFLLKLGKPDRKIRYGEPCPECGLSWAHGNIKCSYPYPGGVGGAGKSGKATE